MIGFKFSDPHRMFGGSYSFRDPEICQCTNVGHLSTNFHNVGVILQVFHCDELKQDAQLSQRDRAAGCVIVFAKSRTLELGDNDLRTL